MSISFSASPTSDASISPTPTGSGAVQALLDSPDAILSFSVLFVMLFILFYTFVIAFIVKIRFHTGGQARREIAAEAASTAPPPQEPVSEGILAPVPPPAEPPNPIKAKWELLQRNTVENGIMFLPNLLLVSVGGSYWQGLTSLQYNHVFMLVLVGYFLLGRGIDTYLVLTNRPRWSSYMVTAINELSAVFAFLGATGATVTLGPSISGIGDPNLGLITFSWVIVALMIKAEVIGWHTRKLLRRKIRSLYPTYQDEEIAQKKRRYQLALRAELESMLPFFFLSYLWIEFLPSSYNPLPGSFEAIVLAFVLCRFLFTAAFFLRWPTIRLVSWATGLFLMSALAGWMLTIVFFSASVGFGPHQFVPLAFALLVLHQLTLSGLTERARYASGTPQVPEDAVRLLVSVQTPASNAEAFRQGILRHEADHLESLEHCLIALFASLFALRPIVTLSPSPALIVLVPAHPILDWLTVGALFAVIFFKVINSVVMGVNRGYSKFSYVLASIALLFFIMLALDYLARYLKAEIDSMLFVPIIKAAPTV